MTVNLLANVAPVGMSGFLIGVSMRVLAILFVAHISDDFSHMQVEEDPETGQLRGVVDAEAARQLLDRQVDRDQSLERFLRRVIPGKWRRVTSFTTELFSLIDDILGVAAGLLVLGI